MTKKIKIALKITLVLIVTNSFSQTKKVDNIQTAKHYQIPGTKYLLIAPDETFTNSTEFTGFQNKELETGINITEIPMPYDNVLKMFTKDLPPQNGELLLDENLIMNGYDSKLFKSNTTLSSISDGFEKIPDTEKTITWILIYGNGDFTLVITSAYKSTLDPILSDKIKSSLLSFLYLENIQVNPTEQLSFNLDIANTDLKFATILMQTGVAYTLDGKLPTEVENKSGYIVMIMPFAVEENKREQRAIKNVKKPTDNIKIEQINKITLDGLNGYEIIGYEDKEDNERTLNYGTTLFDEDKQYIIIGTSNHELEKRLVQFQNITKSFELKK